MMPTDFAEVFPPHWAAETRPTQWLWRWGPDAPADPSPAILIGDGEGQAVISATPTPGGSWVRAEPEGVVWNLSAEDAASLKGRDVLFGLWVTAPAELAAENPAAVLATCEPDTYGQVIVADWATEPHKGTA